MSGRRALAAALSLAVAALPCRAQALPPGGALPPDPAAQPRSTPPGSTQPGTKEEVSAARRAVEAAPRDAEALSRLVAALAEAGRDDEALHWAVELGRQTGDVQLVATWSAQLDPCREERAAALAAAAARALERARWCREKSYHLQALALAEGALALAEAAAGAGGDDAPELVRVACAARSSIYGQTKAVERLALHRVPIESLPCGEAPRTSEPAGAPGSAAAASGEQPPGAAAAPLVPVPVERQVELRTRHAHVQCALGTAVARAAADLLAALDAPLAARFHDARTRGALDVEILADTAAFTSGRPGDSSAAPASAWELAFLDAADADARRVVVLDPRAVGEPLERLWGLVAREACRDRARTLAIPPPPWLERGLALGFEGVRLGVDGGFDLAAPPEHRLEQVIRSLKGRGPLRPSLRQVLELPPGDARATDDLAAWAWALVHYLRHAEGDDGQPLWADRFDRLVADLAQGVELSPLDPRYGPRAPAPVEHFTARMLPPGDPRGGIGSLRELEAGLAAWLSHEAALRQGKAAALAAELEALRRSRADAEWRARRLQRVLAAWPADEQALALLVEVEAGRREHDAALLAARRLAAVRPPDDADRFAELLRLDSRLAADLAADDAALRADVEALVGRYRARGFPRAGLAVLDAALAAVPLDAGLLHERATLARLYDLDDLVLRHDVDLSAALSRAYGDRSLWLLEDGALSVRLADRAQPDALRGLLELQPPCEVAVTLHVRGSDGGGRVAGLTFGAEAPERHGEWGLFVTPAGRIELATRGGLEWPSDEIGRVLPGAVTLEVRLDPGRFEVRASGVEIDARPLGARPPAGWLGLYVRRAEATVEALQVTHRRDAGPPLPWYGRGRP